MYGMHPNAEIGQNTIQNKELFNTIMTVSGASDSSAGSSD